jgi:hypothetical protein
MTGKKPDRASGLPDITFGSKPLAFNRQIARRFLTYYRPFSVGNLTGPR